ncbi:MAG: hypothetical protein ACOX6V_03660 [Patescibacteria group bacterium]|jgi:hypothetical protein
MGVNSPDTSVDTKKVICQNQKCMFRLGEVCQGDAATPDRCKLHEHVVSQLEVGGDSRDGGRGNRPIRTETSFKRFKDRVMAQAEDSAHVEAIKAEFDRKEASGDIIPDKPTPPIDEDWAIKALKELDEMEKESQKS